MNFKDFLSESWDYEKRAFKRQELQHELGHETNNVQIVINGKNWKVIRGGRENSYEMRKAEQTAAKIVATLKAKGKQASWHITGAPATE